MTITSGATAPSSTDTPQALNTGPLDVLGLLFEKPTLDPEGIPIGQPAVLPGWHVNAPWPIPGWDAYRATPKAPRRVFGGGVTLHYTFASEAEFLAALKTADLTEPLPIPDPKMVGVLFEGVRCSATKEDQAGLVAVISAYGLAPTRFQPTAFDFVNGNRVTLHKDNLLAFVGTWMPFRQSFFKPG